MITKKLWTKYGLVECWFINNDWYCAGNHIGWDSLIKVDAYPTEEEYLKSTAVKNLKDYLTEEVDLFLRKIQFQTIEIYRDLQTYLDKFKDE